MVLTARLDEHALGPDGSLFIGGDCASRGSDACKVAALPSSPYQCFVDNVPVLGSVQRSGRSGMPRAKGLGRHRKEKALASKLDKLRVMTTVVADTGDLGAVACLEP